MSPRSGSAVLATALTSGLYGLIAFWGSENLFWSAPTEATGLLDLILTATAYSVAVASVLGAVIWSGITGWRALFFGGALLGWLVEGVLVSTAYEGFPFQLVWTPLAWHGVITGLALGGIVRAGPRWRLGWHLAALTGLGLFGGMFAQLWPLERPVMPGFPAVLAYLAGVGLVVPLAGILLDRVALPASVTGLHKAAWLIAGLLWLVQSLAAPSPLRLSVPLLIWVTVWAMKRQPAGLPRPPVLPPAPLWRHGLFLLTPVLASVLAVRGWALIGGMEIWAFALVLSATGLGLWFWLIGAAVWRSLRPAVPSG